jgi:hypothetical protein
MTSEAKIFKTLKNGVLKFHQLDLRGYSFRRRRPQRLLVQKLKTSEATRLEDEHLRGYSLRS